MAGAVVNAAQLNQALGQLATDMIAYWQRVDRINAWLAAKTGTDLEGMGFAVDDIPILRSAVGDLAKMRAVYYGQDTQGSTHDFSVFVNRLAGPI